MNKDLQDIEWQCVDDEEELPETSNIGPGPVRRGSGRDLAKFMTTFMGFKYVEDGGTGTTGEILRSRRFEPVPFDEAKWREPIPYEVTRTRGLPTYDLPEYVTSGLRGDELQATYIEDYIDHNMNANKQQVPVTLDEARPSSILPEPDWAAILKECFSVDPNKNYYESVPMIMHPDTYREFARLSQPSKKDPKLVAKHNKKNFRRNRITV
jgi:hypothetical protein